MDFFIRYISDQSKHALEEALVPNYTTTPAEQAWRQWTKIRERDPTAKGALLFRVECVGKVESPYLDLSPTDSDLKLLEQTTGD